MLVDLSAERIYLVLLICTLPVCAWVVWSDLRTMKIPNRAVIALGAIFLVVGAMVLPFENWAWRWVNLAVVLAIGFLLNALANVGAGDAKFAAAAALYVRVADTAIVMILFAAFLLGAFFSHRIMRAIPAVRRATPDWVSWQRKDFPMGLALVGTLVAYMALMAFPGLRDYLSAAISR
jgi:prepilin peptidase CpaA